MLTIKIDMGNAAFEDNHDELTRILKDIARKLEDGQTTGACMDSNGNHVGTFTRTRR